MDGTVSNPKILGKNAKKIIGTIMQQPNVSNLIKDPEKDVTYNIVAYRKLSRGEMVQAVRHYHIQKKAKKPKKGDTITIITIIGHND